VVLCRSLWRGGAYGACGISPMTRGVVRLRAFAAERSQGGCRRIVMARTVRPRFRGGTAAFQALDLLADAQVRISDAASMAT
jgi:hypothetical protein